MKFKLARADNARSVLEGSAFENCPNCGQPLAEHRAAPGSCYLCLQVIRPQEAELTSESVNSDLNARIEDIDVALRRHTSARRKQVDYVGEIAGEKARLDREVAELLGTYESDRAARTRGAERELAELQERRRFLNRVRAMPAAVESMLEAADGLNAQLALLERQIRDEQQRLSEADENFRLLEANFLEALLATKVPGVSPTDRIEISRRTLVPTIHPEGRESEGYTFFTAGSGGKKTLFTICFALALHRTAAQKSMPVPSLLIIDTPLKNITPDINPALVTAFYDYLYDVAASDLFDCQIVIIDQLLVAPTPVQAEMIDFSDRLMSLDDPEHPPLISYYNGP